MTIPVVPGPWSWVAQAGQGVADYINAKTQSEMRDREEARKYLGFIFEAVQKGAMSTSALKSPAFLGLVHKSGLGDAFNPSDVVPNPEAQIKQGQSDMISQIMGGTPEIPDLASAVMGPGGAVGKTPAVPGADTGAGRFLLSTGKIPTKLDLAEVNAKTAQADLQGATATAQLPEAAATGVAGQQAAQDQTFNDIADRVVEDLYNTTHQIPSPQAAYSFGQRDPRAQAFGPRINEPYYGRAVQRLQDKLAAQRAAALRAAAAYSSGPQDRTVRDIATQQTQLRSQIAARLSENSKLMGQLSTLARYGTPSEFDKKILSQIAANEEANKQDQTTLDGLTNQAGEVIGTTPKVTTNAPKSGRTAMTRIEWRRRRDAILAHPNDPRVKGKTVEQLIGPEPTQ